MSEPVVTACERITTIEDEGSVNERLSTGGPGPEGQADTVVERLSGQNGDAVSPPNVSAHKAEWVEHAVSQGADRDQAEAMTKADLLEQYGQQ